MSRLLSAWKALLGQPSPELLAAEEEIGELGRRIGELEFELNEAKAALEAARSRLADSEAGGSASAARNGVQNLLEQLAGPVSQIRLQQAVMEAGREVSSRSVMAVARQTADRIEQAGLEPIGAVGIALGFDPRLHHPMSSDTTLHSEEPVVIRCIGYRYGDVIVRKALVERNE